MKREIIDFHLEKDTLIICKLFTNKNEYDLKNLASWTENHYSLLGLKTGKAIIIKLLNQKDIILYDKEKLNFEIISNYLKDNHPEKFISKNKSTLR